MTERPAEIVACLGGDPTDEQWAAVTMPLEPYVIVAGAGSGKTAVMAARVLHLAIAAEPRIAPGNVLCLTFTNKATANLTERVRRALAMVGDRTDARGRRLVPDGDEPYVTNYHGFAQEIVRRHGMRIGYEPNQQVLTPSQARELCGKVLDRMGFATAVEDSHATIVGRILALADQAADHLVTPQRIIELNRARLAEKPRDTLAEVMRGRIELAQGVETYLALKREYGVIDFGDQIRLALEIVEANPDVAAEYRERFPAVLLDEYQDTNVAQARLLRTLFGDGHPVTAVGDPDQNIYAWRGASLHNLLEFPHAFPRTGGAPARRLPLYTNFRSGSAILASADRIIAPLPADQRPDPEKRLTPSPARGTGAVEVRGFRDEVAEAEAIADAIVAEHDAGTPWKEIAVLCRTHRLYRPMHAAFERRSIPAEFTGLAGLLQLPEVIDVLAYARAVASPSASVALGRILTGPRYRVGIADLVAESLDHLDTVEGLSDEGRARLARFREELADLRERARGPVDAFLADVARRIGLVAEIHADGGAAAGANARRVLSTFLDQISSITPLEGDLTLPRLLAHLDAAEADDEWTQPMSDADAVKVMTIHAAKGLEFDAVFVPGLTAGILPNPRIGQNPTRSSRSLDFELRGDAAILPTFEGNATRFSRELKALAGNDERRTCYVALTRARRRLWASGANWYEANVNAKNVGEFLLDLWTWVEDPEGGAPPEVTIERIDPAVEGEENPLEGARLRDLPPWPGPARPDDADELFPEGWRRAAAAAAGAPDGRGGGGGGRRPARRPGGGGGGGRGPPRAPAPPPP
ncbi:MAG: ATP-dependent helicase, partial [Actinomycetota bacterium]